MDSSSKRTLAVRLGWALIRVELLPVLDLGCRPNTMIHGHYKAPRGLDFPNPPDSPVYYLPPLTFEDGDAAVLRVAPRLGSQPF
jgi:hypothetical protein